MTRSSNDLPAFLLLCMGCMLLSCNVSRHASPAPSPVNNAGDSPRILFLNFEISRDTVNATYTAHLINAAEAKGSVKIVATPPLQPEKGDLALEVLDADQGIMKTIYITNPLDKPMEFVNDARELEYKMISLDTAEFSVRLQLEPGASFALLKRITGPDSESEVLLKTPIP